MIIHQMKKITNIYYIKIKIKIKMSNNSIIKKIFYIKYV